MVGTVLVNVTEEIVRGLVSFLLHGVEYQTFCHCEQCEMDVIAIALNALPVNMLRLRNLEMLHFND